MTQLYSYAIIEMGLGLGVAQREICRFVTFEDAATTLDVLFEELKERVKKDLFGDSTVTKGMLIASPWKTLIVKVPPLRMEKWYSLRPVSASEGELTEGPLSAETLLKPPIS